MRTVAGWFLVTVGALSFSGCFLGYDSSWGAQKRAQQNYVRTETPHALRPASSASALNQGGNVRTLRVRLHATRAYAAGTLDWQRRFRDTLLDVNRVLGPTLSVRLEVAEARHWNLAGNEDKTSALLAELTKIDAGSDVDWVIGLVSSVPRFEANFHELGVGELVGNHIVLRAIDNAAEYQVIEEGLGEISAKEREKLRTSRLSHKVTAVVLHELGHTLGAIHERNAKSLMHPVYGHEEEAFSAEATDVMRFVLAHRKAEGALEHADVRELLTLWRREPSPWIAIERDHTTKEFEARLGASSTATTATTATASTAPPATAPSAPPELSDSDRRTYLEVRRLFESNQPLEAHRLGEPLFSAYPSVEAVQDLRCQIAMSQTLPWQQTQAECEGLMKLMPNRRGKTLPR
jgi:hypothetical protein